MLESIIIIVCTFLSVILFSALIVIMIDMYDKVNDKCTIVSKKQLYELLKQHGQMQNYALDLFMDKKYNRFPRE